MPLFAYVSPDFSPLDYPPHVFWTAFGLIVGVLLLLVFVIILWMVLRHLRKGREFLHGERLKALEVGQAPIFSEAEKSREDVFWIAFWMGAGVPIAVAWAASVTVRQTVQSLGLELAVWIGAAAIGVASVICATVLMVKAQRMHSDRAQAVCRKAAGAGNRQRDAASEGPHAEGRSEAVVHGPDQGRGPTGP